MLIHHEKLPDGRVAIAAADFEDIMDVLLFDEARANASEILPIEIMERLLNGESPVRVWREYRGMVQADLGKMAGVSQTSIAEIESGRKNGSIETLKAIASALGVDLEDII